MHDILLASFDFLDLACDSFTYTNYHLLATTEARIHYSHEKRRSSEQVSSDSKIMKTLREVVLWL